MVSKTCQNNRKDARELANAIYLKKKKLSETFRSRSSTAKNTRPAKIASLYNGVHAHTEWLE